MKLLQERHGVTNSAFASILLLVLATLWITTTVFSAETTNADGQTLVPTSSADEVVMGSALKKTLRDCAASC